MNQATARERIEKRIPQDLEGLFFGLHKLGLNDYEYEIVQLTLANGKIIDIDKSPASIKAVCTSRLADLIERGGTVESLR